MFLTEYNEEKVLEKERQEGKKERDIEVASDLIKSGGLSASFIARISRLSEDTVRSLAKSLGIAVL